MKIINDRETEVTFGSLESGEVFEWAEGFYIKTTSEKEAVRLMMDFWIHLLQISKFTV